MKTLKLDHSLAQLVIARKKTTIWCLFDENDLSVDDEVGFIDKVDRADPTTWKLIGKAKVYKIIEQRLGDISEADIESYEHLVSREEMLKRYQQYYGLNVSLQTPVKLLFFTFSPAALSLDLPRSADKVLIYADGASRGNPGPSASGYVIYDDQELLLNEHGEYIGVTTNNQAEYTALKLALEEARRLGAREVNVYMDSLLVINQMKGMFKVKNRDLWPIHDALQKLCEQFSHITFTQVPRELNKLADAVANEAIDIQQGSIEGQ